MKHRLIRIIPVFASLLTLAAPAAPETKPLKALLVIGGCCHDYKVQKEILSVGIEARANIKINTCYSKGKSNKTTFACYKKENWADGYDVIIHDECSAQVTDVALVNRILEPHRKGLPGVNLHCAMHSYRTSPDFKKPLATGADLAMWFDYIGLQSSAHGPKEPITVTWVDVTSPITLGFETWTTGDEELYNNVRVHETTTPLAMGKQGNAEAVVAWTHEYGDRKTRVFSTTLGHQNETVFDKRYLDLVTRGLLWACGKLEKDGTPTAGYGPAPTAE